VEVTSISSIIESLKAMSLTLHAYFKLNSLDYGAIKIEFVNCIRTKFNGDIFFELLYVHHPLRHSG